MNMLVKKLLLTLDWANLSDSRMLYVITRLSRNSGITMSSSLTSSVAVNPVENAYIECFNVQLWDECLNEHVFRTID